MTMSGRTPRIPPHEDLLGGDIRRDSPRGEVEELRARTRHLRGGLDVRPGFLPRQHYGGKGFPSGPHVLRRRPTALHDLHAVGGDQKNSRFRHTWVLLDESRGEDGALVSTKAGADLL